MAQQTLNNGDALSVQRGKINNNALDAVSKSDTASQSLAGDITTQNVTLANDKKISANASGTGITTLIDLNSLNGLIASLQTISKDFRIKCEDGLIAFRGYGNQVVLNIDASDGRQGIITGGTVPTVITTGAVNGFAFDSLGTPSSSRDTTGTATHHKYYSPNGKILSLQTEGINLQNVLEQVNGSWLVRDSANSQIFQVTGQSGIARFAKYGAGTTSFDSSGNLLTSSDSRLKIKTREFTYGSDAVNALSDQMGFHKWNNLSGYDTENEYASFWADEVFKIIPEAAPKNIIYKREEVVTGKDEDGNDVKEWQDTDEIESDYHTLDLKPIIMALCNAHKDQSAEILAIKEVNQEQTKTIANLTARLESLGAK